MSHQPPGAPEPHTRTGFNFSTFFIQNPVTTLALTLILVVLGVTSYFQMSPDLFPNIEFPIVVVSAVYPGAAPAEVETLVTKPIEDAVAGISGLDTLSSSSLDGVTTVICQLQIGVSAKDAANDIRDKVSAILYKLPKDVRPPIYSTFSESSLPSVYYTVTGPMSDMALSTYVNDVIVPRLEHQQGVATVQLTGNAERTAEVALDPDRLAAYNLSVPSVFMAVQAENYNLPGGVFDSEPRQLSMRTMGKYQSVEELSHLKVPTSGGPVELRDLGAVRDTIKDRTTYSSLDGKAAIVLGVLKQTTANSVDVVKQVDAEFARMQGSLPPGVKVTKASDLSKFIKMSSDAVWEHLAIGAFLAVLVLVIFLRNVRVMLIAGLAIPLSIVMAFILMRQFDFTFNNITTLALSLVVGILVDDAVVDLENIYRHMEHGESPITAAINATGEIQLAVTATTMSIVGVFLPMAFMTGMIGQFFKSFALTVVFAVSFSLLIARTLTPMLAAHLLKVKPKPEAEINLEGDLSGRYARLLRWCLEHRAVVIGVATLTFIGGLALTPFIPKSFMSAADRSEFYLRIQMPKGTPIANTLAVADSVAQRVTRVPGVEHVVTTVGAGGTMGPGGGADAARLDVLLVDRGKRKFTDAEMAQQLRDEYAHVPGMRVMADQPGFGGGGQKPIDVQILGDDLDQLRAYSDKLAASMNKDSLFADVETSLADERSELRIVPDRDRMAQYGLTATSLATNLLMATTGSSPCTLSMGRDEVDVWVRLDEKHRKTLAALSNLPIQTSRGTIPLSAIARIQTGGGFSVIEHVGRVRVVHVSANLLPGVAVGVATDRLNKQIVPALQLPSNLTVDMQGQAKRQADAFAGFGVAMIMGIGMIFFVLVLQFSSFLHPFTIMFSLPLSVSGALLALLIFHKDLGMMSLIGIIMLMGIVTKNAILIVDFILTMRERGYDRREAVLRGAQVRLRPILMTTAAMVLGMAPMALGIGAGSEFRAPMAVVVIGGLLTSTFLTLVVVPVAFTLMDDFKAGVGRLFRRKRGAIHVEVVVEPSSHL